MLKAFQNEAPCNSAAAIPGRPYVSALQMAKDARLKTETQILMGGGQEAMSVTTTAARQGHFEIKLCHQIFEEEVARIKGGFGPCNT